MTTAQNSKNTGNLAEESAKQEFILKEENNKKESQRKAVYFSAIEQFFEEAREQFYINKGVLIAYLKKLRSAVASRAEEFNVGGGRQERDENSVTMDVSAQLALLHEEMAEALYGEATTFSDNMEKLGKTLALDIKTEHGQAVKALLEEDDEFQALAQQHNESSDVVTTRLCQHFADHAIHDVMTIAPGVFSEEENYHYSEDQDENDYFRTLANETRHAFKAFPRPEPGQPLENLEKEKHASERWSHLLDQLMPAIKVRSMLRQQHSADRVMSSIANNPVLFAKLEPVLNSAYKRPVNEVCSMFSRSCAHVERCNLKIKERSINQAQLDPFDMLCQMHSSAKKPKENLVNDIVAGFRK